MVLTLQWINTINYRNNRWVRKNITKKPIKIKVPENSSCNFSGTSLYFIFIILFLFIFKLIIINPKKEKVPENSKVLTLIKYGW